LHGLQADRIDSLTAITLADFSMSGSAEEMFQLVHWNARLISVDEMKITMSISKSSFTGAGEGR